MHWMAAAFWSSSEVPSFFFSLLDGAVGLTESSIKPQSNYWSFSLVATILWTYFMIE
jgi:hypothetical protein